MEIMERVLGQKHPNTLNSMVNLASTMKEQDRKEEVELMAECVQLCNQVLHADHSNTLSSAVMLAK